MPLRARDLRPPRAEMLKDHGSPGTQRAMTAMLRMKKIDLAELKRAHAG